MSEGWAIRQQESVVSELDSTIPAAEMEFEALVILVGRYELGVG